MKLSKRTVWRYLAILIVLLLAAGLAAPYLSADRFGRQIRQSLEQALGRTVEIGGVHLNLFNGPGFSLSGVVIHEDPAVSLEPFAYIASLEARVSFASLWTGRLEFSNLRLDEPSINLVKPRSGPWNFEALLSRTAGAATARAPALPDIQIRGGRINFKFGDTKSVFYFTDPDVDIMPPSSQGGEWRIRFSGEPARTDRTAIGFGSFSGRGRWRPDPRTGGTIEFFLDLDRSPIGELATLIHGHDIGVHGHVTSRARLAGPVSNVQITGRMQVSEIYRWDQLPPHGEGWPLDYRGTIDLVAQRLELETAPVPSLGLPFSVRFRASDYLSRPRWGLTATLNRVPAAPLAQVARNMGITVPADLAVEGDLVGVVGYSPESGLQGKIASQALSIKAPQSDPIRLTRVEVVFDRTLVRLAPATVITSENERAIVEGEYSWLDQALQGSLSAESMSIAALRSGSVGLLGAGAVPLLENCEKGAWRGQLRYRRGGAGGSEWTGSFQIDDARVTLPGMAAPLELASARVVLRDGGAAVTRMRGRAGSAEFQGEYRYRPNAARPHQFQLSIPSLDAAELERLFLPTLYRRESFLSRALRLGRARLPAWMDERHAGGRIDIGEFTVAGYDLENVRARLRWDAATIDVSELEAHLGSGILNGRLGVNLRRASPVYRLAAKCHALKWRGGVWDGEASLQTAGTGRDVLRNLRAEGTFTGHSIEFDDETGFESVSGAYQLSISRGSPRFSFRDLHATAGRDVFQGTGLTHDDGRLHFDLSDGYRQLKLTATLSPFQIVWE